MLYALLGKSAALPDCRDVSCSPGLGGTGGADEGVAKGWGGGAGGGGWGDSVGSGGGRPGGGCKVSSGI